MQSCGGQKKGCERDAEVSAMQIEHLHVLTRLSPVASELQVEKEEKRGRGEHVRKEETRGEKCSAGREKEKGVEGEKGELNRLRERQMKNEAEETGGQTSEPGLRQTKNAGDAAVRINKN
ncbi:hypothetical protein RRG08_015858 [Elysia crispata]|uniref:Uncharacterized protein n=1 Tax=Elysia crispata TaxID=231223 RepID=A0AAE0XPW3_9GAST|nr:hypothetical protein RRG08_015858 [Elysia crispata]